MARLPLGCQRLGCPLAASVGVHRSQRSNFEGQEGGIWSEIPLVRFVPSMEVVRRSSERVPSR
eukprot:4890018-Prymnesium_polylepis.1